MNQKPSPQQRIAVVTGGAMGIGAEVCGHLSAAGHFVLVADQNIQEATATAQRLSGLGGKAMAVSLDV